MEALETTVLLFLLTLVAAAATQQQAIKNRTFTITPSMTSLTTFPACSQRASRFTSERSPSSHSQCLETKYHLRLPIRPRPPAIPTRTRLHIRLMLKRFPEGGATPGREESSSLGQLFRSHSSNQVIVPPVPGTGRLGASGQPDYCPRISRCMGMVRSGRYELLPAIPLRFRRP